MREKDMSDNRSKFEPRLEYIHLDHFAGAFRFVAYMNIIILGMWLQSVSRLVAYTLAGELSVGDFLLTLLFVLIFGFAAWAAWRTVDVTSAVIDPLILKTFLIIGLICFILTLVFGLGAMAGSLVSLAAG